MSAKNQKVENRPRHSAKQLRLKSNQKAKNKVASLIQEGESVLDCVRRVTKGGILVEPKDLYSSLVPLPLDDLKEGVKQQYRLACKKGSKWWVTETRLNCRCDMSDQWIDDNLPSLDGSRLPKPKKNICTSEYDSQTSKDIRLLTDPSLPGYQANAADDNSQLEEVIVSSLTSAVKEEIDSSSLEPVGNQSEQLSPMAVLHCQTSVPESTSSALAGQYSVSESQNSVPESQYLGHEYQTSEHENVNERMDFQPSMVCTSYAAIPQTFTSYKSSQHQAYSVTHQMQNSDRKSRNDRKRDQQRNASAYQLHHSFGDAVVVDSSSTQRAIKPGKRSLSVTILAEEPYGPKAPKQTKVVQTKMNQPYCLLSGCCSTDRRPKRHAVQKHLPTMFREVSDDIPAKVEALKWLVCQAFGKSSTLDTAVDSVNKSGLIPEGSSLDTLHTNAFIRACEYMGIPAPSEFTLHPINSPAVLLFWRCLIAILNSCNTEIRKRFYHLSNSKGSSQLVSELQEGQPLSSSAPKQHTDQVLCEELPSDLDEVIPVDEVSYISEWITLDCFPKDAPQIYDSHFHLDRTSKQIWNVDHGHTVEELLAYSYSDAVVSKPAVQVNVVGGIMVFSEPKTYPPIDFKVKGPWRIAVGVHPKYFETLTVERTIVLQQLLGHPRVVALGECGLDRTVQISKWSHQEEIFCKLLRMAKPTQTLVLHLRGIKGDTYSSDVYARGLMLLEAHCTRQQKIHVHCFMGKAEMVKAWLSKFPNSYFGVTAAVTAFDHHQINGLKTIPKAHLLLETDSPHFPPSKAKINTPAYIGEVATFVSVHLDMRPSELMHITTENAKHLYES